LPNAAINYIIEKERRKSAARLRREEMTDDQAGIEHCQRIREHLSRYCLLSEEKIDSLLPRLCSTLNSMITNLEELAATDTGEAVSRASHTLRGALLNLGLSDLAEKAFIIELSSSGPVPGDQCIRIIHELKEEINKLP
jgi:HPt (histidine-containing phosphotransfer) domain-containing protein